jgi:pre-mRNA-splicing factor SYF1
MISYAINIYDSMVNKVRKEERAQAYCVYICKVAKILGITKTRAIFEAALQKLSEKEILSIGREYAKLEMNLGEIERSRAVYVYISQFTDPRDDMESLWEEWQTFEVEHGDKETYKEYLRVKRSVEAKYQMLPPDLEKIEEKVKKGLL